MKLIVDIINTKVLFDEKDEYLKSEFIKQAHRKLGAREQGYIHNPRYKAGVWDGIIDFYDITNDTFPTGLLNLMEELLGDMQAQYGFQYEIVDDRPDPFIYVEDMSKDIVLKDNNVGEITLRNYQYGAVKSIIESYTGIIHAATNAGKTEVAGGLMQELLPYLERGERIAFFTDKKEIFEQSALRIQERLGIKVGMIGGGKKDVQQVTFVMIPTINANLKDPEKGVKLTAKEQLYKKISKQVLPRFEGGKNQRKLLEMYIKRFQPKTKADLKLLEELQNIYDTCGTDNSVLMKLRNYNAMYMNTVQKKNKKVFDKHQYIREFLDSVAVMICDEAHHTGSDTWYNSLMTCKNAQYRVGLTGSIDKKNELLNMRLNALFGGVVSRVENDYLISQGHSAKPTIKIFPISAPNDIEKVNQYQPAYDKGIVNNVYRNTLIAKLGKMWYDKDKGVLIIVNHIKHGENISELLDKLNVEHYFIHGELDDDTRRQKLNDMRTGKLKVMIATSIVDEGVDISGIHALVLAAGGKSLRQTLQRVGRALRKKKDDNTCQVFDFTDYTNKFLLSHSKERRKIYLEEKFDIVDIQPKN